MYILPFCPHFIAVSKNFLSSLHPHDNVSCCVRIGTLRELGVPFINISAPSVVPGMSGESKKTLRDTFDEAKRVVPCLLFVDEMDAITPKRESVQREMERWIVAQLLTCMDGAHVSLSVEHTPVLILGQTCRGRRTTTSPSL